MKNSKMYSIIISIFLIVSNLITIAVSSFIMTNEPSQEDIVINSGLKAVCYNDNTKTYYTSIEKALNVSKSEETIYTIPGVDTTISSNCSIPSGVTLCLPFGDKTWDVKDNIEDLRDYTIDTSSDNVKRYRQSCVSLVNSTLTIEEDAQLLIGGKFRAKGICDLYTEISLDVNSNIKVHGTLINYGYIKEKDGINPYQDQFKDVENKFNNEIDSKRHIEVFEGGLIKNALAIYSSLGASYLAQLNNNNICPVDTFDFPNIQTFVKIHAGGTFQAQAKIYIKAAGVAKKIDQVLTVVSSKIIAEANNYKPIFLLNDGYMSIENSPSNTLYSNSNSKSSFNVAGNMNLGFLYIDLEVAKIDTSKIFLPISYKFNIFIKNTGSLFVDYKIKFLPGSKLEIEKGGKVTLNNEAIFYKADALNGVSETYPENMPASLLLNNGAIVFGVNSSFGGNISTKAGDGTATIDTTQINMSNLTTTSYEGSTNQQIKINATGDFYNEKNGAIENKLIASGKNIISCSDGKMCWANGFVASYSLIVNVINIKKYEHPVSAFKAFKFSDSGETYLSTADKYEIGIQKYEYLLEPGDKFKINTLSRNEKNEFTTQENSSYTFEKDKIYEICGNIELTITAGEGCLMHFTSSSQSGNGGSTKTVYESDSNNGVFNQLVEGGNAGSNLDFVIGKNQYFKYLYKKGTGTATFKGYYKFEGYHASTDSTEGGTPVEKGSDEVSNSILADKDYTILAYLEKGACFEKGTLISTERGEIPIEQIQASDMIKSYNHITGKYEYKKIAALINHGEEDYNVINLYFSDGTDIGFISSHGLFDLNLNKYVDINEENYKSYIGHTFAKTLGDKVTSVTLSRANVDSKKTNSYTILSSENINCEANGLVNITSILDGVYNIFEYDENHNYDKNKMENEINKYGLFTYEDFKDRITEKRFKDLGFKYFKVSIGKGLLTSEILEYYNNWFDDCIESGEAEIY